MQSSRGMSPEIIIVVHHIILLGLSVTCFLVENGKRRLCREKNGRYFVTITLMPLSSHRNWYITVVWTIIAFKIFHIWLPFEVLYVMCVTYRNLSTMIVQTTVLPVILRCFKPHIGISTLNILSLFCPTSHAL